MKVIMVLLSVTLLTATPVYAQDDGDTACEQIADGAWRCSIPTKPPAPPTCHVYGDSLICTSQVDQQKKKPVNCGWNRASKYVCW